MARTTPAAKKGDFFSSLLPISELLSLVICTYGSCGDMIMASFGIWFADIVLLFGLFLPVSSLIRCRRKIAVVVEESAAWNSD